MGKKLAYIKIMCYLCRKICIVQKMADKNQNNGIAHNVLVFGSKIKGNIVADSDFRIDGEVEGDLNCSGKVVVGPQGVLKGNLICQNAEINGQLDGTMTVSELLSLTETARVKGEIKTKLLMIEPKAIFCGTCDMSQSASPSSPKKA